MRRLLKRDAIVARAGPIVWFVSRVGSASGAVGTDDLAHVAARRAMRGLIATAVETVVVGVRRTLVLSRAVRIVCSSRCRDRASSACAGIRWICDKGCCTLRGASTASRQSTLCAGRSYALYAICCETIRRRPTCSSANGRRHLRPMRCAKSSAELDGKPVSSSRCTRTCYGTPPAVSWPTTGRTHGRSNITLGHRNIQHTTRYTELASDRFKDFCEIDAPGRARRK